MCLLMVTMGELPNREFLVNASKNNPDGFGFAVNHGDRIVTGRSMRYENLIDRFLEEMTKSDNPVGVYHARYTTHGKTMLENNHPFRVDGRKDIVLAHNGMLPITPRGGDVRSDTRIFAEDVLGSLGVESLDDKATWDKLEYWAQGSKIAILSTAPELRDSVYILNEHLGDWVDGIWWSNSSYRNAYSSYTYSGYYSGGSAFGAKGVTSTQKYWWNDDDYADMVDEQFINGEFYCSVCAVQVDEEGFMSGICSICNSCLECFDNYKHCDCYNPSYKQLSKSADKSVGNINQLTF